MEILDLQKTAVQALPNQVDNYSKLLQSRIEAHKLKDWKVNDVAYWMETLDNEILLISLNFDFKKLLEKTFKK